MKLISALLFGIFWLLNTQLITADYPKSDELTLRNQLLSDVFFLKEGVDRLLISSEVLNKRFNNQMEILKDLENKLLTKDLDSGEEQSYCDKITGMFNATIRKQNMLESRLLRKLDEVQDEQLARFEEIIITHKFNKTCNSPAASSGTLSLLSTTLADVSEKIDKFDERMVKLELLDGKLNSQQTKFDKFVENHLKILQQINEKLATNEQQFDKIKQELTIIKNLKTDVPKVVMQPRPKLPMEVILGLTSANVTSLK